MEMYTWLRGLQRNSFHICLSFSLFAMIFQNQRIDKYNEFALPAQEASRAGNTLLTVGKKVGLSHGGRGSCYGLVDGGRWEPELRWDEA
jgi:hypothetical protein